MDSKRKVPTGKPSEQQERDNVYVHETPRWRSYYLKVRKTIRFPRYYKRSLNW
jgi:hypothetical protein